MSTHHLFFFLSACTTLALIGCGEPNGGGQFGEEGVSCEPVDSVPLAIGADAVLGFSGQDILDLSEGIHAHTFTYGRDGSETGLTLTVTWDGEDAVYYDNELDSTGSGPQPEIACQDTVAVGVTLTVATDDGAFDEAYDTVLAAAFAEESSWSVALDLDALGGDFQITTEVDPSAYDELVAYIGGTFDAQGSHGSIDGQAIDESNAGGPDGTVSAEFFEIGHW